MSNETLQRPWLSHRWRVAGQTLLAIIAVSSTDIISTGQLSVWRIAAQVVPWTWALNLGIIGIIAALLATGRDRPARTVTLVYLGVITAGTLGNVMLIVISVVTGKAQELGTALLWDTIIIWVATLLVFTLWYWLLDGGGPEARLSGAAERADLIFPQQGGDYAHWEHWRPGFTDYLFHSLAANAAFAPGDVMVMSQRFKWLQIAQTLASLLTLTMLAAKAVDLL